MQGSNSGEVSGEISVVGGVYRERCRLPDNSDEVWGSGGRAAAVLAGLGLKVRLHTVVDASTEPVLLSLAASFDFNVIAELIPTTLQFQYDHALATPVIWPPVITLEKSHLKVDAESVLVFGMLETDVEVSAKRIVYDPQNPISPVPLERGRTSNAEIAYVLNGSEASKLGGTGDHEEAARYIVREYGAAAVVVKRGAWGAYVFDGRHSEQVPAYATERVWPIGSGDVFAAVFAARWATGKGLPAIEAAHEASRGAALYVNDRVLPLAAGRLTGGDAFPFPFIDHRAMPVAAGEYQVYLAGPFFSIAQKWLIEEARLALKGMGLSVFSPLHDVGLGDGPDVAPKDIEGLKASRCVLALVDGLDAGTVFEIGYARSLAKPVIALAESTPLEALKMIAGTKCEIVSDFVTAIYRTAWTART